MLLLKFTKVNSSVYTPHLDSLRHVIMTIRRAQLKVGFSDGFNPHMQLFFSSPMPIGTASECEYFTAFTDEDPAEFMRRFNEKSTQNIQILKAVSVQTDPNVHSKCVRCEYEVGFPNVHNYAAEIDELMSGEQLEIDFIAKGKPVVKDVRPLINSYKIVENKILLNLAFGNSNLRADRLCDFINRKFEITKNSLSILKKKMFADFNGQFVDIDDLYFD